MWRLGLCGQSADDKDGPDKADVLDESSDSVGQGVARRKTRVGRERQVLGGIAGTRTVWARCRPNQRARRHLSGAWLQPGAPHMGTAWEDVLGLGAMRPSGIATCGWVAALRRWAVPAAAYIDDGYIHR